MTFTFQKGPNDELAPNCFCWECGRRTMLKPDGVENHCQRCLTRINLQRLEKKEQKAG